MDLSQSSTLLSESQKDVFQEYVVKGGSFIAVSKDNVPIRLPDERWQHITARHPELVGKKAIILDIVSNPDEIRAGKEGERIAIRQLDSGKYLAVFYRETAEDGFITTAYETRRVTQLRKRKKYGLNHP